MGYKAASYAVAFVVLSSNNATDAFSAQGGTTTRIPKWYQTLNLKSSNARFSSSTTTLNLFLNGDPTSHISHVVNDASSIFLATIDSDIASIPDDQFGKVFAGGGLIILGSILSTIFVGFMLEKGGGYADLVAETYAEQNYGDEGESFLDSLKLTPDQKKDTEDMVREFREKKMRKAGTWTDEDEMKKQQMNEEKNMFDDYD